MEIDVRTDCIPWPFMVDASRIDRGDASDRSPTKYTNAQPAILEYMLRDHSYRLEAVFAYAPLQLDDEGLEAFQAQ